jgi:hypothetical protein
MNWKALGAIIAIFGVGALVAGAAEGSEVDRKRRLIRAHFEVAPNCQITYTGNPATAGEFWSKYDSYLLHMIRLAAPLQITDPAGLASYVMLNLFPECDQTQQMSNSFLLARKAAEIRIGQLLQG